MDFHALSVNSERMRNDFDELSQIGATISGGVTRTALSNEDMEARMWLSNRLEEAGAWVQDDEVGNISGVLYSGQEGARNLLTGSHLDTVPNAGRYDGSIGVLASLECLRVIKENHVPLKTNLEVIDFTDEEGGWYSLFGSLGLTGQLEKQIDFQHDRAFHAALYHAGLSPRDVRNAFRDPATIAAYVELHIEQSDQLYESGQDIGIVSKIVGRTIFTISFFGKASHAGTTAMRDRRDALYGASKFITAAYDTIRDQFPAGVLNCGNIRVEPGAFNVIPAKASIAVECRHPDMDVLARMEQVILQLAEDVALKYLLMVNIYRDLHRPSARMDPNIMKIIESVADQLQLSHRYLCSYAGHDAQILSHVVPSAMIFIPSHKGISHSPEEYTPWESVVNGANTLLQTLIHLGMHP